MPTFVNGRKGSIPGVDRIGQQAATSRHSRFRLTCHIADIRSTFDETDRK
jgi:hypothetical protein